MLLSVLSALARLDLDPWREAAELARMPQQIARQRLTSLIEALPNQPPTRPEPEAVSTRLIALLPPAASPSVASSNKLPGGGSTLNFRAVIYVILVNLLSHVRRGMGRVDRSATDKSRWRPSIERQRVPTR